ncbi:MAG: hypothetical protein PVSMB7_18810 [Chloroflexota bacterium]
MRDAGPYNQARRLKLLTISGALLRFALLLGALVVAAWLVVAHGVRGLVVVLIVTLLLSVPRTRGWQVAEGTLVRFTGSRRRAGALVGFLIIGAVTAFEIVQLIHGG